uniref:Tes100 n=1 Tax=Drosophila arizonae TaxID=7263 RepID=Q2VK10_DROAR|nr:Tes100 [Drosophila arizonae]
MKILFLAFLFLGIVFSLSAAHNYEHAEDAAEHGHHQKFVRSLDAVHEHKKPEACCG